jgi:hypothetical protein
MTNPWQSVILRRAKQVLAAVAVAAAVFASMLQPARAADTLKEVEVDRWNLSLGSYFVTRTNGTVRLDRTAGVVSIGTSIDWERDLGGETSMTVPRIDGYYRFAPKHRVDFSWYKVDRNGTVYSQRSIDFGNISFPAGSAIESTLNTATTKVAYTYSFYRAPEIETAVSVGLHVTGVETSLTAAGLGLAGSNSITAPLPVIGFRLDYAFTPKWWMRTKYELFFLDSVDKYKGSLSDFTLAVEHRTFQHVGFGFGLDRNSIDVEVTDTSKQGAFSSVLSGFMLYVTLR